MTDPLLQSRENKAVNKSLTSMPYPHIEGLNLGADVVFNELTLNTIDANGVVWIVTDILGWWNLPDSEIRDVPRGWADGSYDVTGKWKSRMLTLNGVILPPDPSLVPAARNTLLSNAALVYDGAWLRVYETPQKAAFVRLSGTPSINTVNARGRTEFSIGLKAPDPIKYQWNDFSFDGSGVLDFNIPCKNVATGATGKLTLNNTGNWDTSVRLEINGPIIGPAAIENETTGELIIILDSLSSGDVLEIDTYRQEVALNGDIGDARSIIDTLANWIVLAPGNNVLSFYDSGAANSTADMSVYFRPAWIS